MNNIQDYGMTNYQIGFQSNKNTVKALTKKFRATRFFRDIERHNEILTEEEQKKVQAILDKYLPKQKRTEIKSSDGDVLFIANPTKEEIQAKVQKEQKDIEEAAEKLTK